MQGTVTIESWKDVHHTFVSSINTSIIFQTFHSLKLYVHWCCLLTRYGTLTWIWNGDKDVFKENKKYPKLNFFYWKQGHRMTLIWTVSCYHVCCCNLCFVINILHTQKVEGFFQMHKSNMIFTAAQTEYDCLMAVYVVYVHYISDSLAALQCLSAAMMTLNSRSPMTHGKCHFSSQLSPDIFSCVHINFNYYQNVAWHNQDNNVLCQKYFRPWKYLTVREPSLLTARH